MERSPNEEGEAEKDVVAKIIITICLERYRLLPEGSFPVFS